MYIFFFNFFFKLYIIVLVLPNIKMNPPQDGRWVGGARSPSTGEGCDLVACGAPRPGVAGTGSPGDSLNVGLHLTQIEMGVPAQGDQGLGLC